MFKQHARRLLRLDPKTYFRHHKESEEAIRRIRLAQDTRKGSALSKASKTCRPDKQEQQRDLTDKQMTRQSLHAERIRNLVKEQSVRAQNAMTDWQGFIKTLDQLKGKLKKAKKFVYMELILGLIPVLGLCVLSLALSWTFLGIELDKLELKRYYFMDLALGTITVLFQAIFALAVFCFWSSDNFFFFLDVAVIAGSIILDIFQYRGSWTTMDSLLFASYISSIAYCTVRSWSLAVESKHSSWTSVGAQDGLNTLDLLHFVWVTRSASLAAAVLPDIDDIVEELLSLWQEDLQKVCRISVYVTDKSAKDNEALKELLEKQNSIFKIDLNRPNFETLLENHMIEMIDNKKQSRTVVAFCGSPQLASTIQGIKLSNDAIVRSTGYKYHGMEFIAESYGGVKSPEPQPAEANDPETHRSSALRRTTKYHGSNLIDDMADLQDDESFDSDDKNKVSNHLVKDKGRKQRQSVFCL